MNQRNSNVGTVISDAELGQVQGGVTVATEGDYNIGIDLKPLKEPAKKVWKEVKKFFGGLF